MASILAVTSVPHVTSSLFAQSENTINEDIIEEVLENKETNQHVEKAVGDIEINEVNFPDVVFKEYIRTGSDYITKVRFDTNGDDILSSDEIANITRIHVGGGGNQNITSIDVSKNTALIKLA